MMLIRSQDRLKLVPLNRPISILRESIFYDDNTPNTGGYFLGTYASESRCLEILDEIQAEFQYVRNVTDNQGAVHFIYEPPKVYQMPEK